MCWLVKCGDCGKTTWAGCGLHVEAVMGPVPENQKCICVRDNNNTNNNNNMNNNRPKSHSEPTYDLKTSWRMKKDKEFFDFFEKLAQQDGHYFPPNWSIFDHKKEDEQQKQEQQEQELQQQQQQQQQRNKSQSQPLSKHNTTTTRQIGGEEKEEKGGGEAILHQKWSEKEKEDKERKEREEKEREEEERKRRRGLLIRSATAIGAVALATGYFYAFLNGGN